jgi:hypothetical protein
MGDFSHTMTVRQLVDLQTYLRSVKEKGRALGLLGAT